MDELSIHIDGRGEGIGGEGERGDVGHSTLLSQPRGWSGWGQVWGMVGLSEAMSSVRNL